MITKKQSRPQEIKTGKGSKKRGVVRIPDVDVRKVPLKMGLSQTQFATKFGFPTATLRNWEQGRVRPDAPTRVLLAVIDKHPQSGEDVLANAI
jgi:putative transcriptional regulator